MTRVVHAWPGRGGLGVFVLALAVTLLHLARGSGLGREEVLQMWVIDGVLLVALWWQAVSSRPKNRTEGFRPAVVVPTHGNVETVVAVVRKCLVHCSRVVVVDDGSTDGSGDAASQVEGVVVLRHGENKGKGAALETALRWALESGCTHLVTIDSDGQHLPDDLPLFLEAARTAPDAIHVGCRDLRTAPKSSRFGRRFSNFWTWVETGTKVGDSQSGYRVYPVVPVLSLGLRARRFEWEVEVLVRGIWAGIPVQDLPCRVWYPPQEERVTAFRPFWDNARISWLNTRLVAERLLWPPRWIPRWRRPRDSWKGTHLGRLWGWRFFVGMIRRMGRPATYLAMRGMALFYLGVARDQRAGVQAYLVRRFPEQGPLQRLWSTYRIFYNFGVALVDRFVVMLHGPESFQFLHENTEAASTLVKGEGAIMLSSHLGNADLAAVALGDGRTDLPVNLLQYRSGADPYLALWKEIAPTAPMPRQIVINTDDSLAALEAVRVLRNKELLAIKADRVVDDRTVEVLMFGGRIRLPTGPFLLAAISGAPVFMMGCFKEGPTVFRVLATEPKVLRFTSRANRQADLEGWATEYGAQLERWARRYPFQWYNFHNPWI